MEEDELVADREFATRNDRQKFSRMQGDQRVMNEITAMKKIQYTTKSSKNKDKSDYAIVEKVIDKKTERMFEKW